MAATNFTPIQLYNSSTAAATPLAANLANGELAINIADGKLYYKDSGGVVQLLASSSGASGNVVGPASSTDNAISRFDGTTGKLIQDSVVTIADTTGNMAGVGTLGVGAITTSGALVGAVSQDAFNTVSTTLNLGGAATAVNIGAATGTLTVANATLAAKAVTATSITNSALTATRLVYSGTAGLEVDSANLTFNGTDLTVSGAVNAGSINATTLDLTNLEVTNIKAKDGTASIALANTTGIATFSNATVISTTDNTNAALRITQLGTGNALLVEDSTNPDSTPFVIDASGAVIIGYTALSASVKYDGTALTPELQKQGLTQGASAIGVFGWSSATSSSGSLSFNKSKSGTIGTRGVVASGDVLGSVAFAGDDGTNFIASAAIRSEVDGTPGTNDMPGRLVFSTTADGASSPTERMRIDSAGNVGIGGAPSADVSFIVSKNITGGTTAYGIAESGTVQSAVTAAANMFLSNPKTVASAFTLTTLNHYSAIQGSIGATSAVTNQFSFNVASNNTGATNNYGFYSNLAAATNTYNFYAAGTATNYFGGNTIISVTDNTNAALRITQLGTGNALLIEDETNPDSTPFVIDATGRLIIGGTAVTASYAYGSSAKLQLQNSYAALSQYSANTSGNVLDFLKSRSATIGTQTIVQLGDVLGGFYASGSDGVAFIPAAQILAQVDGTPGTNDMPGRLAFSTTADGASSPTERMRIDSAGNIGIGNAAAATAGITFDITKSQTGAAAGVTVSARMNPAVDVTANSTGYQTFAMNGVGTSTTNFLHYNAIQGTFSGTAPTNQYGFSVSGLTGATNNYGFYSGIAAATNRYNFYAAGTADNYFAGSVGIGAVPTSAAKANITSTSAGASTIALSLQNASNTINSETVLDFVTNIQGAGVRSAQISAINTNGSTGVNMLFKIGLGAVPTEAMRLDSVGNFIVSIGAVVNYAPGPAGISAAATLTNANIQSQIINTTGTTYTVTMPLGTTLETLIAWTAVNLSYNFSVINTATGIITMAVNTGVTSLGSLIIAAATSAQFRIRRTAANTFILYRLA